MRFLLVSGAPLREPVARYGPFVMNTFDEIRQALLDLQAGTFVYGGIRSRTQPLGTTCAQRPADDAHILCMRTLCQG